MELRYKNVKPYPIISLFINGVEVAEEWVIKEQEYTESLELFEYIKNKYSNYEYLENLIKQKFSSILGVCCPIILYYSKSIEEKAEMIYNIYESQRTKAFEKVNNLISRSDELNGFQEDEIFSIIRMYNFNIKYESNFSKKTDKFEKALKDALEYISSLKKK